MAGTSSGGGGCMWPWATTDGCAMLWTPPLGAAVTCDMSSHHQKAQGYADGCMFTCMEPALDTLARITCCCTWCQPLRPAAWVHRPGRSHTPAAHSPPVGGAITCYATHIHV
jgi:hypothetical protein